MWNGIHFNAYRYILIRWRSISRCEKQFHPILHPAELLILFFVKHRQCTHDITYSIQTIFCRFSRTACALQVAIRNIIDPNIETLFIFNGSMGVYSVLWVFLNSTTFLQEAKSLKSRSLLFNNKWKQRRWNNEYKKIQLLPTNYICRKKNKFAVANVSEHYKYASSFENVRKDSLLAIVMPC